MWHLLLACNGGDTDGGNGAYGALPEVALTWLTDGDGDANALPVEPMRAGFFGRNAYSNQMRWTGPVDAGADEVSSLEVDGTTYGDGVGLYRDTRDGVAVHALDSHLSPETRPALIVADELRVGMSWESELSETLVNQQVVVAHNTGITPLGPLSLWGIADREDESVARVRWYGEDIGRVEANPQTLTTWDPLIGFTEMIVPMDPQARVELALDPLALTPLADPFGRPLDALGRPIGLSSATIDGTTWLYLSTIVPAACAYCSSVFPTYCVELGPLWRTYRGGEHPSCPVYTDGTIRSANQMVPGTDALNDLVDAGQAAGGLLTSWASPAGVQTLTHIAGNDGYEFRLGNTRLDADLAPVAMWRSGLPTYTDMLFVGPASVDDADAVVWLAAIDSDGRVFRLEVRTDSVRGFDYVGVMPGARSASIVGDDRHAYGITLDGRMFRVRVDQDTGVVHIDSLGDALVDDGTAQYEPIAMVVDDDIAYIATMGWPLDLDGDGAWDQDPFYGPTIMQAPLDRDPIASVSPASLGIGYGRIDGGIAVCWPPTDAAFSDAGWTVAGQTPRGVYGPGGLSDSCAVLVPSDTVDPAWVGAERAVDGPVPGVGRVRLGFGSDLYAGRAFDRIAVAAIDGGAIDRTGARWDAIGMPSGGHPTGFAPSTLQQEWHVDVAGRGMFQATINDDTTVVENLGGDTIVPPCTSCTWAGSVEGGGMLLGSSLEPWRVLRPSGETPLPLAQQTPAGGLTHRFVLTDGRVCGYTGVSARCLDAAGQAVDSEPFLLYSSQAGKPAFWPMGDGTWLVANEEPTLGTTRLETSDMSIEPYDARALVVLARAADGRTYGITVDSTASAELVEVTLGGLVVLERLNEGLGGSGFGLVPLADQLALFDQGAWRRIPR